MEILGKIDTIRRHRIKELYTASHRLDSTNRKAFLERECGTDRDLLNEVLSLVEADGSDGEPGYTLSLPQVCSDQVIAGRFRVISKIGEGGMGIVWKARDTRLDRFVAVKVLPSHYLGNAERKLRFIQEAKAASALNHPNIVSVYDVDNDDGIDFIAMEYVAGQTLHQRISGKSLELSAFYRYAVQIADAIAAAHAAGVLHRDIKPSNILVTDSDLIKVLDFGLAKLLVEEGEGGQKLQESDTTLKLTTKEGAIFGTPSYMSPEQAQGKPGDARSDVFSIGAVLYEMLSGQRAFPGRDHASALTALMRDDPPPLTKFRSDVPAELDRVIRRCLRKDANRRFQHVADLKVNLLELDEEKSGLSDSGGPSTAAVKIFHGFNAGCHCRVAYRYDSWPPDLVVAYGSLDFTSIEAVDLGPGVNRRAGLVSGWQVRGIRKRSSCKRQS